MTKITVRSAQIHLQFHGMQRAVPVEDLRPGMVTMWNGGVTYEVAEVRPSASGKTFQLVYANGTVDHRRFRAGCLIAVA